MITSVINLLIAIFRAFPSLKELVSNALNSANETEAINRKIEKDRIVDEAIDNRNSNSSDS